MRDLAIGGLASGLPTNDIVDAYAASLNIPIDAANKQVDLLKLRQDIYRDLNKKMQAFKNNLIDLNLAATFNSKLSTNSNPSVLSFIPSATTPIGSYRFDVLQLAEPARASSIFTTGYLSYKGANVNSAAGRPTMYDQVEGRHNISIQDLGHFDGTGGSGGGGSTDATHKVSPFTQTDAQAIKYIAEVPIDPGGGGSSNPDYDVYVGSSVMPGYASDGTYDPNATGKYVNKEMHVGLPDGSGGYSNLKIVSFGSQGTVLQDDLKDLARKINAVLQTDGQTTGSPIEVDAIWDTDANGWRLVITDTTPGADKMDFSLQALSYGGDFGVDEIGSDTYTPPTEQKEVNLYQRFMFANMSSFNLDANVDADPDLDDGVVSADKSLSYSFSMDVETIPPTVPATIQSVNISINFDIKKDETANDVMAKMTNAMNDAINTQMGTSDVKYFVPAVEREGTEFKLGLYGGSSQYKITNLNESTNLLGGINRTEYIDSLPVNHFVEYIPGSGGGGVDDGGVSAGDVWIAKDIFEFEDGKVVTKHTNGLSVDTRYIDTWGRVAFPGGASSASEPIEFIIDGVTLPPIYIDLEPGYTLTEVLSDIEDKLNDQINNLYQTGSMQYVALKAERDATSGEWTIATYDVSGKDLTIAASLDDPLGSDALALALGFGNISTNKTQTMVNMIAEKSARNLELRLGAGISGTDDDPSFSHGTGADGFYLFNAKNAALIRNVGFATPNFATDDHSSDPANSLKEGGFVYETTSRPGDLGTKKSVYTSGDKIFDPSALAGSSYKEILNGRTIADLVNNGFFNSSVTNDKLFSFEETEPIDTNGDGILDGTKVLYNYGILEINDVQIKIRDNMTLSEMMGLVNSNPALDIDMYYDENAEKFTINSPNGKPVRMTGDSTVGAFNDLLNMRSDRGAQFIQGFTSPKLDAGNTLNNVLPGFSKGIFTINDVSIYYDPSTDTLNDVMNRVNKSNANVIMSFNSGTQSIEIRSTDGTDLIKIGSDHDTKAGNFLEIMNLTTNANNPIYLGSTGHGAEFDLNGIRYTSETNNLEDIIEGASITLYSEGITVVDVTVDTEPTIDAMASFVANYNDIMTYLTADTGERKRLEQYKNPLSSQDAASMSDKEIESYKENWKKYHTADIILSEATMRSIRTKMRTLVGSEVKGTSGLNFLSDFDIRIIGTGDSFDANLLQKGLLMEDTTDIDQIKKLLEKNDSFMNLAKFAPNALHQFFSEVETIGTNSRDIGLSRLYNTYITNTTSFTGPIQSKIKTNGSIDKHLAQLYESIETISRRNEQALRSLSERFVNMELRVSQLQSQSNYLAQQLNIGG